MQGTRYDIFNVKSEEVKFNAFFQYLKSFSETGLDTLQKLEAEFNREMRTKLKHSQTLPTIKNLLSSYEIFILQIKDSCDFVQISQFGYCIGKAFLQLLKIIKWFLKTWLKDSRKYEKLKASFETDKNIQGDGSASSGENVCSFCEEVIRSNPYGKDTRNKRRGRAMGDIGNELREAKKNYKTEVNHLMEFKDQILEKYTHKQLQSRRFIGDSSDADILNRKQVAMKLEMSNNQTVLEEVLNQFSLKTEAMARFVSATQAIFIQDFRLNHDSDYSHFEEQMKEIISHKFQEAKVKMKELVQARINEYQQHKRDKQIHIEVQTMPITVCEQDKGELKVKQLGVALQRMKNELESQKALTESLRRLLESKSVEFQKQFLNYRKQVFDKSKHQLKSLKSFKDILKQDQDQEKGSNQSIEDSSTDLAAKKLTRKTLGLIKDKDKFKKIQSIKFAANDNEEAQIQIQNTSLNAKDSNARISSQSLICYEDYQRSVEVQTEAITLQDERANIQLTIGRLDKVSQRNDSFQPKPLFKDTKKQKIGQQKSQTHLYAHIRSKIFEPKDTAKPFRKELKAARSSFMGNLAKKLAPDTVLAKTKPSNEPLRCFKITSEPLFSSCSNFYFNRSDIYNIFIDDKHAYHYESIIYRNCMFNFANLNPKRAILNSACVEAVDAEWIFKKDFIVNDKLQVKLSSALHQQLCILKRKYGAIYEQVKQILRSPFEVSKNIDVIQLQKTQTVDKDIELGQLKKMINLLMRFHADCVGDQDGICEHILKFYDKLGVKFKQ